MAAHDRGSIAMTPDPLGSLGALLRAERNALLTKWRHRVRELPSARHLDVPTLNDHMPALLQELDVALGGVTEISVPAAVTEDSATAHGLQRLQNDFDIDEVVSEYGILRACIHDLAEASGQPLQGRPVRVVNRLIDDAIGVAVQTYATQKAREVSQRREEYLAFVAHDLRTPLAAVALAGRLLEQLLSTEQRAVDMQRLLKSLRRNVQHLERMVAKVLDENMNLQTEAGVKLERREVDLWPLVETVIQVVDPVAGASGTRLVNRIPDELFVYADATLLTRVLQNLMANAIKYTPQGSVTVEARSLDDAGAVECIVRDDGAGIPAAIMEKIFDKGETDSDTNGGMGLGLAIVRALVEAHGGEVSAESREGLGSRFRFTLPGKPEARSS